MGGDLGNGCGTGMKEAIRGEAGQATNEHGGRGQGSHVTVVRVVALMPGFIVRTASLTLNHCHGPSPSHLILLLPLTRFL